MLEENFKAQFVKFNKEKLQDNPLTEKEWKRVFNEILGKSVFKSAKILRDNIFIKREDESDLYLSLEFNVYGIMC